MVSEHERLVGNLKAAVYRSGNRYVKPRRKDHWREKERGPVIELSQLHCFAYHWSTQNKYLLGMDQSN